MALIKIEFDSCLAPGRFLLCRALDPEVAGPVFDLLDEESTRPVDDDSEVTSLARSFGWEEDDETDPTEYLKTCAVEERVIEDPGFFAKDKSTPVEIYFRDLTAEKQREVLEALGVSAAKHANLDLVPLAVLDFEEGGA